MISDWLRTAWLQATFDNTTYTSPATVYLALLTSASTNVWDAADKAKEVSGDSYARIACSFGTPTGGGASDMVISNDAEILSAVATGDGWGTITHVAVVDHATPGSEHLLFHGALTASKTIDAGDQFRIAVGNLDISLAGT